MIITDLGIAPYQDVLKKMREFTDNRDENTPDEIWLVEHPPVFTQGQAGKAEHILDAGDIPVIQSDRGGQVTYHGPGQLVAYTLFDVRRAKLTVRKLVSHLENAVIKLLADYDIQAHARLDAPGVYVDDAKICSLGLRLRRGYSYHGLALNVAMDLEPFSRINPCGHENMQVIDLKYFISEITINEIKPKLTGYLKQL